MGNAVLQRFEILEVDAKQSIDWNRFVWTNPCGTIFQSYDMLKVYEASGMPAFILGLKRNEGFSSGLLAHFVCEREGVLSSLSRRCIVFGGPLYVRNGDLGGLAQLLQECKKRIRRRALFAEVKNHSFDSSPIRDIMISSGFEYNKHLNLLMDLTQPMQQIWCRLRDDRRKGIRKAERIGISVEKATGRVDIAECYRLLKETLTNARVPLAHHPSGSFLDNAFRLLDPAGLIHLFVARFDGRAVAASVVLSYKDRVYNWYQGSALSYRRYRPNDVLVWQTMMWAKDHGYKVFDFLGAGTPGEEDGVRDFKSGYGAQLVEFGLYKLVNSPIRYMIAQKGFGLYRRFFLR